MADPVTLLGASIGGAAGAILLLRTLVADRTLSHVIREQRSQHELVLKELESTRRALDVANQREIVSSQRASKLADEIEKLRRDMQTVIVHQQQTNGN